MLFEFSNPLHTPKIYKHSPVEQLFQDFSKFMVPSRQILLNPFIRFLFFITINEQSHVIQIILYQ